MHEVTPPPARRKRETMPNAESDLVPLGFPAALRRPRFQLFAQVFARSYRRFGGQDGIEFGGLPVAPAPESGKFGAWNRCSHDDWLH